MEPRFNMKPVSQQTGPSLSEPIQVHLNPIRAGLVKSLDELTHYPFSGHCVLMGKVKRVWQETERISAVVA
jgi:hypothetical protein